MDKVQSNRIWSSYSTGYEELLWDIMPCSSLLATYFVMFSCLAYSLALKMEKTCSWLSPRCKALCPRRQNSSDCF
jgi:hypothetical protein